VSIAKGAEGRSEGQDLEPETESAFVEFLIQEDIRGLSIDMRRPREPETESAFVEFLIQEDIRGLSIDMRRPRREPPAPNKCVPM